MYLYVSFSANSLIVFFYAFTLKKPALVDPSLRGGGHHEVGVMFSCGSATHCSIFRTCSLFVLQSYFRQRAFFVAYEWLSVVIASMFSFGTKTQISK